MRCLARIRLTKVIRFPSSIFALFLLIFALNPSPVLAGPFALDLTGGAGYFNISGISGLAAPTLVQFEIGTQLSYAFTTFLSLGAESEYRLINQYSSVVTSGNFGGSRWNFVAPMLELRVGDFVFQADYQLFGSYRLTNATYAGQQALEYETPRGWRIKLLRHSIEDSFGWGAFYEKIDFKGANFPASPLQTWQAGLTFVFRVMGRSQSDW